MGVDVDGVYPALDGCETAFVGFCAAFMGRQDAAHIAHAGLQAVCVDRDAANLKLMEDQYPHTWEFVDADVYAEAERRYARGERFDVVSLDPWTPDMQDVADQLDLWASIATRKIILGTGPDTWIPLDLDGWPHTDHLKRSRYNGGVYWTVLERT